MNAPGSPLRTSRLSAALLAALGIGLVTSCDSASGQLLVGASVAAFRPGTKPAGLRNVTVKVADPSTGAAAARASATLNGVALNENGAGSFEGSVDVAPGAPISLMVKANGSTVEYARTAFAAFPAFSSPDPGNQSVFCNLVMSWSAGSPDPGSTYGLGILDAANPNGSPIWPNADLQQLPLTTTSYTIPIQTLLEGDRILVVGLVDQTSIPGAAADSVFILGGFDAVRVQMTQVANLTSVSVSPQTPAIPSGSLLGLTALGTYCDATRNDLTTTATWSGSAEGVVRIDASSTGVLVAALGPGTSTVTATSGTISGSAEVDVRGTLRDPGVRSGLNGIAGSGTLLVVVGDDGLVLTSADGINWNPRSSGSTASLRAVAWSGTTFVAVGDGGVVLSSPDGLTWTARSSGTTSGIRAVSCSGGTFVAVGDGGLVLTSLDAVTWTQRDPGMTHGLWAVVWSGSRFVTVGDVEDSTGGGYLYTTVLTSADGISWTRQIAPTGGLWALTGLASSSSGLVATSAQGDVLTSPDGTSWTVVATGLEPGVQLLASTWSGRFVVVGTGGVVLRSADGASWTPLLYGGWTSPIFGTVDLRGVTALGDQLVAVGSGGAVYTSF
jgi:hypothetical protein